MEPDQPLEHELAALLNRHSLEGRSDTPDFILAQYLIGCLHAWNAATLARDQWSGRKPTPGPFEVTALRVGIDPGNMGVSYPRDTDSWSPDFGRLGVPARVLQDATAHVVEDSRPVATYDEMLEHLKGIQGPPTCAPFRTQEPQREVLPMSPIARAAESLTTATLAAEDGAVIAKIGG